MGAGIHGSGGVCGIVGLLNFRVMRKLDTFPHLLTQKAPKSEPVAPSYPPWTFGDLVGALWY